MQLRNGRSRASPRPTLDPPQQVVEALLARVPFPERVRAAGVCHAWRQHLSQPHLQLWQALSIEHQDKWDTAIDEDDEVTRDDFDYEAERRLQLFLPLQRWLWTHGGALLQVQCNTAFNTMALAEDGLLAAFLQALAAAAPSLQLDPELAMMGLIQAPLQLPSLPSAYAESGLSLDDTEVALLAQQRGAGMPPIRVVADLPQSDQWAAVHVDLPFEAVNEVLGVQLERSIMRGVPT